MNIKQIVTTLILVGTVGLTVFIPSNTFATSCGTDGNGNPIQTSILDCTAQTKGGDVVTGNGAWGLLKMVIQIMTAGVGILAVGGIVYGAVLYSSAGGSPEQVKKAISIITNVVIGLLAYVFMYAITNFLIPGGLF